MKAIHKQLAVAIGVFLVCCGLISMFIPQSKAQGNPNRRPEAILVQFRGQYVSVPGGGNEQVGLMVHWTSASAGAPVLPRDYPFGQVVADLVGQGYSYQLVGVDRYLFTK